MYTQLKAQLDKQGVELVAVSKTKPHSAIENLYAEGQRVFGENRVQELVEKYEALPKDIDWHMIGVLQKNKVKYIAPFISLIHSVDSLALAKVVNKEALKNDRVIDILLQVKVAQEDSKSGFEQQQLLNDLAEIKALKHIQIRGLMGMGTFTNDEDINRKEFQELAQLMASLKEYAFKADPHFGTLSMGMSGDYQLAIANGSTMVRIGSLLFGSRA